MGAIELILIAIGLSMDAFAVSICQGLSMNKVTLKKALIVGLYFGIFQAAMPLIGYLVGKQFSDIITSYDHWIAFILLGFIGARMVIGSLQKDEVNTTCAEDGKDVSLKPAKMLPLAIATSIDALAVGVTFAFIHVKIVPAIATIGIITLILSMIGVQIGNAVGIRFKDIAELAGGIILILIGLKILLEHLGIF